MQSEISLRLLDPEVVITGIALVAMALCAFMMARRFRVAHLHFAAACLLAAAIPPLVKGGLDILIWFGLVSSGAYPPNALISLAGLRPYFMLFSAASISFATWRLLRQGTSP
jgi:hypothetical protein